MMRPWKLVSPVLHSVKVLATLGRPAEEKLK